MAPILVVVGDCCVGKTTFIDQLNEQLAWNRLSIDQERAEGKDWPNLIRKVRELKAPTVIESIAMPAEYRIALRNHQTTIFYLECDERERVRRAIRRGDVRKLGSKHYPSRNAHRIIDTTTLPTSEFMDRIASTLR